VKVNTVVSFRELPMNANRTYNFTVCFPCKQVNISQYPVLWYARSTFH